MKKNIWVFSIVVFLLIAGLFALGMKKMNAEQASSVEQVTKDLKEASKEMAPRYIDEMTKHVEELRIATDQLYFVISSSSSTVYDFEDALNEVRKHSIFVPVVNVPPGFERLHMDYGFAVDQLNAMSVEVLKGIKLNDAQLVEQGMRKYNPAVQAIDEYQKGVIEKIESLK